MQMIKSPLFVDSNAFIALYVKDDQYHESATSVLSLCEKEHFEFLTSNFVLDEVYTFLRARKNKDVAVVFAEFLAENTDIIKVIRISPNDELSAFDYFKTLNGKGVSFTDCTSFALIRRLGVQNAFTFDHDFLEAGILVVPELV